jgi:hypothetical protein
MTILVSGALTPIIQQFNSVPSIRKKRKLLLALLGTMLILWAWSAYADEVAEWKGPFQKGATEWSLSFGYGDNFHFPGDVREDVRFYFFNPSWGKVLKEWKGSRSLEFLMEGFFAYSRQDSEDRYALGITPLFLYNFQVVHKVILFLELGAGILYTDLDPEHFGSHFNFTPQGGIGLRYEVAPGRFLKLSYLFHHISNGGLSDDNRGINSHFICLGLSFFR